MKHRVAIATAALALPVVMAACGDPDAPPGTARPTTTTTAAISHPTGADDAVVRIEVAGGLVPADVAFGTVPSLLITGDGRVVVPGAVPAIYPGPLVTPLTQRSITPAGIQAVLQAAERAGLLAPSPSYDLPPSVGVADAATTEVVLDAGGNRFVHQAYALQEAALDTPARRNLAEFVNEVSALETLVGSAALGPEQPYEPDRYAIRALANPPEPDDLEPSIVPWPDAAIDLSATGECAIVDSAAVANALRTATQLTWFTQNGTTYSVMTRPVLSGDRGC
jgi:hypothetical protein